MAAIFALSSIGGLRVSEDASVDRPLRVLAHASSYALLAALMLYAMCGLRRPRRLDSVAAFFLAVLYGLSDEIHQATVPSRRGRVEDLVVDAIGAGIGVALGWLVLRRMSRRRETKGAREAGEAGAASRPAGAPRP
jgi:VanZ family protein